MRVAVCADGRSPHSERWANGIAARGHEVAFIWTHEQLTGADLSGFDDSITHHALTPPSPRKRPWALPGSILAPRRLARRLQPDLVHGLWLAGPGWSAHALGVRPLVLTALGSDVHQLTRRQFGSLADRAADFYSVRLTRAAVDAAELVFADSEPIAELIRERAPGTDVRIVRFGVELTSPSAAARADWRRRLSIPDDALVLLSSRLAKPNYNIDTIIRSLPAILRTIPNAVLILKELERFADTDYRRQCLDLVEQLALGEAVRIVGELERSELLALYAAADVFLSVPTRDATAVSVFEAMSAGVPIVATEALGIDPTILNEQTAVLVPIRDPEALAEAVLKLALDPDLRARVVRQAHDVVERYGDFERELDRAVGYYEELVARVASRD